MIRTSITGVTFRGIEDQFIFRHLAEGEALILEREPTNQFDPWAIKVLAIGPNGERWHHIGYVPKKHCQEVYPHLDKLSCRACFRGGYLEIEWALIDA